MIDQNQQIISDWVNDSSRELIAAFNKAMEDFEVFNNWKGSNVQGPPGAWNFGRPSLIVAGNELVEVMQKSSNKAESNDEDFLSFSNQTAQLLIAMVIRHGNEVSNSENSCIELLERIKNMERRLQKQKYLYTSIGNK